MNCLYREAPLLAAFSKGKPVRLLCIRTDNGSAWTNDHGAIDLDNALVRTWRLQTCVIMERPPPYTQALNPVECSARRFNHNLYKNFRSSHLPDWAWPPKGFVTVQQINFQPI
jgi:hypothetical protein